MDLGEWLAAFRENGIDPSVLPDLTDQDLEKLGVLLGHRRKLLRAITNVEGWRRAYRPSPLRLWLGACCRATAAATQYWTGRLTAGRIKGTYSGNANCSWEATRK